jgi:uncharacterized membrane protein
MNRLFFIPAGLIVLTLIAVAPNPTAAADASTAALLPPPAEKSGISFETDIKPIMEASCTKCHGEEKQKAGLRLDSREAVLAGADGEAVIVLGKSAESELVLVVAKATKDEDEWMPPPGKADDLTPAEVGLLRAWIDQGAK